MKVEFFKENRRRLAEELPGSIIVLTAYHELQLLHDQAHQFRQDASFWYLSGIDRPSWRIIIDTGRHKSYAVYPQVDEHKQLFDGSLSPDDAQKVSGVDQVMSSDEAESLLRQLRREHRLVYMVEEDEYVKKHAGFHLNPAHQELKQFLSHRFESVQDARKYVSRLRAIKQPEEISAMKKAVRISADTLNQVAQNKTGFRHEYEVEAYITYQFRRQGADGHAYQPIIASGINACTLHYVDNNQKIASNSALLIDAGARVDNYSADLSRTLMFRSPTKRQEALYQAVKQVFHASVACIEPGLPLQQLQKTADEEMVRALYELGFKDAEDNLRKYFPHSIGHSLGIDVHDTFGGYSDLKEGMTLTIEPGIYLPEEKIGIRYEDNFLVTDRGSQNLAGNRLGDVWYN